MDIGEKVGSWILSVLLVFLVVFFSINVLLHLQPHQPLLETILSTIGEFLPHVVAVFLELVLAVIFIEKVWRHHEQHAEARHRRSQLRLIKSAMFRKELQDLFVANFLALKEPNIDLLKFRKASLEQLKKWQAELQDRKQNKRPLQYKSREAMEKVIREYVKAAPVWEQFKNFALMCNFGDVFEDMIYIEHLISDVNACHKGSPDACFMREAEQHAHQMERVLNVWGDGIRKFIDYAVELKETDLGIKGEHLFDPMMQEYERAAQAQAGANVVAQALQAN